MDYSELYEKILLYSKKGAQKTATAIVLRDIAINILATMFDWKDLPETCKDNFAEQYNIIGGCFALWRYDGPDEKYKDQLIFSPGAYANKPDVYGIGQKFIANTFNGYVKTLTPGEDCVICWNNSLMLPDLPLLLNGIDMLTESFTSLRSNIIYSRLKPVFKCSTDQEKAAIEAAFKSIKDDLDPINITSKNVLAELEGQEGISVLDITDVNNADKIQFIVKACDDIQRWLYTVYGQAIQGNAKLAQQSVDEVQGTTSTSFILPNDRLKFRRKFCEEANALFSLNMSVDFSAAWKVESIKYKKEADIDANGEVEELAEETEETPADPEEIKEEVKQDEEVLSD